MNGSSRDQYQPLPTAPEQTRIEEVDDSKQASSLPVLERFLWLLLISLSLVTAWVVTNQAVREHFKLSSSRNGDLAHPDYNPLALFDHAASGHVISNPSDAIVPWAGIQPTFFAPTAYGRLQRSQPARRFHNRTNLPVEKVLLSEDFGAVMQFVAEAGKQQRCALAVFPFRNSSLMVVKGEEHHAQVWGAWHTAALDPSTISYQHRPARGKYLGDLYFGSSREAATTVFACPENGILTILLECRGLRGCQIGWMQSMDSDQTIGSEIVGLRLVQWQVDKE